MKNIISIAVVVLAAACQPETSFTHTDNEGENQEGNAGLEWYPTELVVDGLLPDITSSTTLQLNSVGDDNLHIYEVRVLDSGAGVFYMGEDDYEDIVLAPGTSREFPITATMDEWAAEVVGSVRVQTNDIDYISLEIPCYARPAPDWGAPLDTGGDDTGT